MAAVKSSRSMLGPDGDVGDVVGPLLLRDPSSGLGLDHRREACRLAGPRAGPPRPRSVRRPRGPRRSARPGRRARAGAGRCRPTSRTARDRGPASRRNGRPPRRPAGAGPPRRRRPARRAAPRAGTRAPRRRRGRLCSSLVGGRGARAHQRREVQVEQRVERRPVRGPLDHRRGVRRPHRLAVVPPQRRERRHRVDALGERHRDARRAQGDEEVQVPVDQAAHASAPQLELAHGLGLVGGVLEHDAEGLRRRRPRRGPRSAGRRACGPSRPTRRSRAPSSGRGRAAGRWSRRAARRCGRRGRGPAR